MYKMLSLAYSIISITLMVIGLIQQKPLYFILIFGTLIFASLIAFYLSDKVKEYLKYMVILSYITNTALGCFVAGYLDN